MAVIGLEVRAEDEMSEDCRTNTVRVVGSAVGATVGVLVGATVGVGDGEGGGEGDGPNIWPHANLPVTSGDVQAVP